MTPSEHRYKWIPSQWSKNGYVISCQHSKQKEPRILNTSASSFLHLSHPLVEFITADILISTAIIDYKDDCTFLSSRFSQCMLNRLD